MTEEDALKTITLHGAKQLGLEQRIGSIEVGKDGDLAIFNGHPLNSYARAEMALVDGEVYFQRSPRLQPTVFAAAGPDKSRNGWRAITPSAAGSYAISGAVIHGPA